MESKENSGISYPAKYAVDIQSSTGIPMGGIWERVIGSVRKAIGALVKKQVMDDGLATLMSEIEAMINARPLTIVSDNPRDVNALTPNHLLIMKANQSFPSGVFIMSDQYSKWRWRWAQYMTEFFWK